VASKSEMLLSVLAVKQGLTTPDRIQECMDIQRRLAEEKGRDVPLEAILVKRGYLTNEQIAEMRTPAEPDAPRTVPLELAQRIEHFEVVERIAEGGVAGVFRAYEIESGAEVALKVLFPAHALNDTFVERFLAEGRTLAELDHPSIVKGYQVGVWPPEPHALRLPPQQRLYFMSMEFVHGASVQTDIDENGPLEESKALHVVLQIAQALDYLQSRNLVHRDIKPDNILYDDAGGIKLCDLGFAKEIEAAADADSSSEDVTCGTVQYISPEQARGMRDVDIRADIYSLGATLYHLVVGDVPFSGKDSMDIMAAQVLESLKSDNYRQRGLSPYIGYFIEKMMVKDREIRYQTPGEVIEDITGIIRGTDELTYRPEDDPNVQRYGGSSRREPAAGDQPRGGRSTRRSPALRRPGESTRRLGGGTGRARGGNGGAQPATGRIPPRPGTGRVPLKPGTGRVAQPPPPQSGDGSGSARPPLRPPDGAPKRVPPSRRVSRRLDSKRRRRGGE
jgi:serine/threonine protein kinase